MAETYFAGDLSDFLPTKPFSTDGFNAATRSDLGDTFWLGADLAQNSRALEQSMANLAVDPVLSNQAETSRSIASNTTDHLIVQMSELLSGDRLLTDQVSQPASDSLAGAWQLAQAQLSQFLENPEFEAVMATAFGEQADANQARQIIADWGQGQDLPALETMPTAVLQARGAFSASSQTVYLGQDWLEQNSQSAIAAVLLEELGHALDSRLNVTDAAGDEGAIFAALVQGQAIAPAALASLKAENDHALLHWQGSDWAVEQAALGEFTVGATGQVSVEFVFDGGAYTGELALFSLTGLESLMPGSDAYTAEAARRALSGSSEGYVVISDAKQRATVSGELGERDWNQGRSSSPVPVALTPGDRFGFMLAPNGSVQDVFNQPAGDSKQRPLFSMAAANPQGLIQMGQMTNGLFAMEDLRRDRRSDDDFNDLIFKVEGATGQAAALESLLPRRYDWQNTDTFERILAIASPVPPAGPSPNPGGSPDPNPTSNPDPNPGGFPGNPDPNPGGSSDPNPGSPGSDPGSSPGIPTTLLTSFVDSLVKFDPAYSETAIAALSGSQITLGDKTIYIGTQQVSSNNQNPIISLFDSANPLNNWTRTDYETTGADGRGIGLAWTGSDLYGVFTVDGTQGNSSQDFRRESQDAQQSWLRSYGQGGGPKVSVIGRLDLATGELVDAAYLSALLSDGKSNTLVVNDLAVNSAGNLVLSADSFFSPRRPDGSSMEQVGPGDSPFAYTVEILPNLKQVVSTQADGWL